MGARRTDDAEEIRRGEQHLEIDVGSRFDVASKNRDIMGEDTEFELVDDLGLCYRHCRHGDSKTGGGKTGNNRRAEHQPPPIPSFAGEGRPGWERNGFSAFKRADQRCRLSSRLTTAASVTQFSCNTRRSPTCGWWPWKDRSLRRKASIVPASGVTSRT